MQRESRRPGWLLLIPAVVAVAPVALDTTILTASLPIISADLPIPAGQVWWLQYGYPIALAPLILIFAVLARRIGIRRLLLAGIVIFTFGSIAAGQSLTSEWLIAARVVQAVGGGMIVPPTLLMLGERFRDNERLIAFGVWVAVILGMGALGPELGLWLTEDFAWRWSFCLSIAFGLVAFIGVFRWRDDPR